MNLDQLQQLLSVVSQYIVTFFKIYCGKGASAAACFPPSHSFYSGALKSPVNNSTKVIGLACEIN